jgi:citrate lyase subunit beta/citryl-CoA lyase
LANDDFMPTDQEIALAQRIVEAANRAREQGQGVCVVDGKMIDAPFVQRASAILGAKMSAVPPVAQRFNQRQR